MLTLSLDGFYRTRCVDVVNTASTIHLHSDITLGKGVFLQGLHQKLLAARCREGEKLAYNVNHNGEAFSNYHENLLRGVQGSIFPPDR